MKSVIWVVSLLFLLVFASQSTSAASSVYLESISKITVDYSRSISDLLKAGKYDAVDPLLRSVNEGSFLSSEKEKKEVEFGLFHFGKYMLSAKAVSEMKKAGYHPATTQELLLWGENNSEKYSKHPVFALGSIVDIDGGRRAGVLRKASGRHCADLVFFGSGWWLDSCFLAVRN